MRISLSSRGPTVRKGREEYKKESWLPFGYYLQYDADLLIVRRSDGTFVAAFNASKVDLFEVEVAVWEDAD